MKLLITAENIIVVGAPDIRFGEYEGEEKWALFDDEDNLLWYALDNNYQLVTLSDGIVLPEDIYVNYGQYIYQNGEVIQNPDWVAPPPTIEEQVESLNEDIGDDWNANRIYYAGEYAMYKNKLWICKIQHENMAPAVNSPYWENVNIASEFNRLAAMINKED